MYQLYLNSMTQKKQQSIKFTIETKSLDLEMQAIVLLGEQNLMLETNLKWVLQLLDKTLLSLETNQT